MNEFIEMGGYARYVWSAFGLSLLVLSGMIYFTKRSLRNTRAQLARRIASAAGAAS